jgi:hypothetical protein
MRFSKRLDTKKASCPFGQNAFEIFDSKQN